MICVRKCRVWELTFGVIRLAGAKAGTAEIAVVVATIGEKIDVISRL